MSKINILDKSVYNKIAAGEVVEKPASVVKELVENSIDAKATNISIDILDGGITQIKVIDNGIGIDKDDFEKVFMAHATSKVCSIEDLSKIGTLGFRGEALSSIASVSKITMSSKTDDEIGYQIKVNGGELGNIEPIGATKGTYMLIQDLFFNIPARKKFLRKPKLEENDITNYVARLIMANPNISIKYSADNKIIYQSFGTGLYDAIYAIYGKTIVDNIFKFEFCKDNMKFSGYLGKPTFSKPNRTYQTLIVNSRYVINQSISTAVYKAYENFIMKSSFPFYVINLDIPLDQVDINVHPNKLDIKFENANQIFGIVFSEVSNILYGLNNTKVIDVIDEENKIVDENKLTHIPENIGSKYKDYASDFDKNISSNNEIIEVNLNNEKSKVDSEILYEINKDDAIIPLFDSKILNFKVAMPLDNNLKSEGKKWNDIIDTSLNIKEVFDKDFKIIGTLFNTYILIEDGDSLKMIDQHAGHERLLFDKFSQELENKTVSIQPLLVPYILDTNYVEAGYINNNLEILKQMGFECENFGENSFKVSTVPILFKNINIQHFFDNILSDIDNKLIASKSNSIREYIAKCACKSAVKGNDVLSRNEIKYLVDNLNNKEQVLLCPHGRPIVLDIKKTEIEKMFKRIV